MKHVFLKLVFVLSLVLIPQRKVFAQGHTPAETMKAIFAIESSDAEIGKKIKKLHYLSESVSNTPAYDSVKARLAHRLGQYYMLSGQLEKAIDYIRQAIAINITKSSEAERSLLVDSYYNLAGCHVQLNLIRQSHSYYDSCVYLGSRLSEYNSAILWALERKANLSYKTGDYQESIVSSKSGVLLAQKYKQPLDEAVFLLQEAQGQLAMNQNAEAEQRIGNGLQILISQNAPSDHLANGYFLYAQLFRNKGDGKNSLLYYDKALRIHLQNKDWLQCSGDMVSMGIVYNEVLQNVPEALKSYFKGLELLKRSGDVNEISTSYNNIGLVYFQEKKYRKALEFYQKALNTLPIHFADTNIYSNPDPDMLKRIANDYYIYRILSNKAESLLQFYKTVGDNSILVAALQTFRAADLAVDQMRFSEYNEPSKLYWRNNTKKMYENAVETCYLLNDIKAAFYFFEKSRAVLLNDKLNEIGAKRNLPRQEILREQQLHNEILALQQQLSGFKEDEPSSKQTLLQLLTAQEAQKSFIRNLEIRYPIYFQYKYETRISMDSACNRLSKTNQSLIEFFTGDSSLYILSLSKNQNKLIKVPARLYGAKSTELLRLCTDMEALNRNYPRYRTLAHELYLMLIQPLQIPKGRVIISPDEQAIPLEVLLSDKDNRKSFLLKDYAFSYTYSAGFLYRNRPASTPAEHSFLGVAPVSYNKYLGQEMLEGADNSLSEIKNYYRSSQLLIFDSATRKQFIEKFPFSQVIQLYSHADADSLLEAPILYLADSAIYLSEIQDLPNVNTDLIVLSACNTGVGRTAKGEGVFSLARAFSAAGIPSMLTSLWKIDNQTTYKLTELFHKYLSQGLPKDLALQKAKLTFLRDNGSDYGMPYYWASSILLGRTDPIATETKKTNYLTSTITIVALLMMVLLVANFYRKKMGGLKKFLFS